MKILRVLGILALLVGVLGGLGAFGARKSFSAKASKYQVVRKNEADALFGDKPYEPMGSPQTFVVNDPSIILPNKDDKGLAMIDYDKAGPAGSKYVQLKTLKFYTTYAMLGSAAIAAVGAVLLVVTRRKK